MAQILRQNTTAAAAEKIAALLGGGSSAAWVAAQLQDAEAVLFGVAAVAGEHTAAVMGDLFGVSGTDMDAFSVRAAEAARRALQGAARPLQDESLRAVEQTVHAGFAAHLPPGEVARRVRSVVGLDAARAGALLAYEDELRQGGMDAHDVARLVAEERAGKLASRGAEFATVAALAAGARGQLELWREQKAEGLIEGDFEEEFDEPGGLPEGSTFAFAGTLYGPPAHPWCMCGIELTYIDGVFFRVWVRAAEGVDCDICDGFAGQMI